MEAWIPQHWIKIDSEQLDRIRKLMDGITRDGWANGIVVSMDGPGGKRERFAFIHNDGTVWGDPKWFGKSEGD